VIAFVARALQFGSCIVERFSHRERRFLASPLQAAAVLEEACRHLHLAVYDPDRPIAYARTLYLSAPGPAAIGAPTRLRIRQYAAAVGVDEPAQVTTSYLESKHRDGEQRHKVRVRMPAAVLVDVIEGRGANGWHARLDAIPELREVLPGLVSGQLAPRVLTWYRRISLAGAGLRMTMDEGVAFSPPEVPADDGAPAAPRTLARVMPGIIIEVKSSADLPAWLASHLGGLPPGPSSKFEAGVAALEGSGEQRQVA